MFLLLLPSVDVIHHSQKQIVSFPFLSCKIAGSFHITSAASLALWTESLGFNQNSRDRVRLTACCKQSFLLIRTLNFILSMQKLTKLLTCISISSVHQKWAHCKHKNSNMVYYCLPTFSIECEKWLYHQSLFLHGFVFSGSFLLLKLTVQAWKLESNAKHKLNNYMTWYLHISRFKALA